MSNTTKSSADITVRFEPSWTTQHLGTHSCVIIGVEGQNRRVSFVFPTNVVPQHVSTTTCDRWLEAVHGTYFNGCGVDDGQRTVLLHLCLGYRAFILGNPGARPDDWLRFSDLFISAACEVVPGDRVDRVRAIVEWLHTVLPADIFLYTCVIVSAEVPAAARPAHIVIAPSGVPLGEQVALRKRIESNVATLVLKALRNIPQNAQPDGFPLVLADNTRAEDNTHASSNPATELVDHTSSSVVREQASGKATRIPRHLTIGFPSDLVGSVHTPLLDILPQCKFHKVYEDGSTEILPNPLIGSTSARRVPSTLDTVPNQSVRDNGSSHPTVINSAHDALDSGTSSLAISSAVVDVPGSSTPSLPSPTSSSGGPTVVRARRRRVTPRIDAVNAQHRACVEAHRVKDREARAARAAARAARREVSFAAGKVSALGTGSLDSPPCLELLYPDID